MVRGCPPIGCAPGGHGSNNIHSGIPRSVDETRPVDGRSLGDLTKQLSHDIASLVRSEVVLAKAEVADRASTMARGAGMVAAGVLFALIVISCLVTAAVAALSLVVDVWVAALIAAAVAAVIAAIVTKAGVKALRAAGPPLPLDTVESAKEDVAWVKTHAKRGAG
jgi:uncharacterized membrane protein YqjE